MDMIITGWGLGCLAVFVFVVACIITLGLLIAHRAKAALNLFATGMLCAAVLAAVATLTLFAK
jgi:hypothetical protein